MLDIHVSIEGHKVIIEGLSKYAHEVPGAIKKGLTRSAKGIYNDAFLYLSGPGAKGISKEVTSKKTGKKYLKWTKQFIPAGGYPVPVRTGHLRRMLDWLKPGETKTNKYGAFRAGANEVIIYDPIPYAKPIHEGTWTQRRHGKRPFMTNALQKFNQGDRIKAILEEEIQKAKGKAGI